MKRAAILSILLLIETGSIAPLLLYNYLKSIDAFSEEEDAHLDDDNVRKVSELIKKSSEASQFIVITHRDVMMTAADRLFGTSVSKEKISKIVSVELERVSSNSGSDRYGVAES